MKIRRVLPLIAGCALLAGFARAEFVGAGESFPFDAAQLAGDWVESYNDEPACDKSNLHMRMAISKDGKHFDVRLDRMWKLDDERTVDRYSATILSATARTLMIRYDGEKRRRKSGEPVEWELAIVAPGVYRWRETSWPAGEVNQVVGLRCSKN